MFKTSFAKNTSMQKDERRFKAGVDVKDGDFT